MHRPIRDRLLALQARDEDLRAELQAEGSLYEGYHPRMEEVHRRNAAELRAIIDQHGWPGRDLVGAQAAEAAWLVAQHAIAEPDFMRRCQALLDEASSQGRVPRWQFACIADRIAVFEGRAQRYGTQFDLTPEGPVINRLEDPEQVDRLRRGLGLGTISEVLARAQASPRPSRQEHEARQLAGTAWRRRVGWLA